MKSHQGVFKTSVILVIAAAITTGTGQTASAAPVSLGSPVPAVAAAVVQGAGLLTVTAEHKAQATRALTVASGGALTVPATSRAPSTIAGRPISALPTVKMAASQSSGLTAAGSFCATAVTSAVFALGAGAVQILVLSGVGLVVAGVAITSSQLGMLAAGMGSLSALYNIVSIYVC